MAAKDRLKKALAYRAPPRTSYVPIEILVLMLRNWAASRAKAL
jgi:hypothetical protein